MQADAGALNGLVFTPVENLTGGAAVDTFTFGAGKSVTSTVAGSGGSDSLDLSAYTAAVSVNLQTGAATGATAGIMGIESFVGGSASDTFSGANANTTWTVTGSNEGVADTGLTFTNFEILVGGTGNDSFVFSEGAALSGTLSDGGGTDAVNYAATTGPVTINLQTGYAGFETFVGSKIANNTLIGTNAARTFTFTSANVGTLSGGITFAGFENVTGGSGADVLIGDDGVNVLIGNNGDDTIMGRGGADNLQGGQGSNILFGGETTR